MASKIPKLNLKNLKAFAELLHRLLNSDRDLNIATAGACGEGKSTFSIQLLKEYNALSLGAWCLDQTTWSRKELLTWIDGDSSNGEMVDGVRPGQLPEFAGILLDELFLLFYRRNWFDEGQIDAIGTLNMCRDRHLLIAGNIPNFWDLDGAYTSRIRFYVYVPWRGTAWIFEQDNNPFSTDKWNTALNRKIFNQYKAPYKCPNFVSEITYPDLSIQEKEKYIELRNNKRVGAVVGDSDKKERYSKIKMQRDSLISMIFDTHDRLRKESPNKISKLSFKDVSDVIDISAEAIRLIYNGER